MRGFDFILQQFFYISNGRFVSYLDYNLGIPRFGSSCSNCTMDCVI